MLRLSGGGANKGCYGNKSVFDIFWESVFIKFNGGRNRFERTFGAGADFDLIIDENNSDYFERRSSKKLKFKKILLLFMMLWFGRKLIPAKHNKISRFPCGAY